MGKKRTSRRSVGLLTYWSLAAGFELDDLRKRLAQIKLAQHLPPVRSEHAAVGRALREIFPRPLLVRSRQQKDGWVVLEQDLDNNVETVASVIVEDAGTLIYESEEHAGKKEGVLAQVKQELTWLSSDDLARTLVDIINAIGGFELRPMGVIYWIPESETKTWDRVCSIVESTITENGECSWISTWTAKFDFRGVRSAERAITHLVRGQLRRVTKRAIQPGRRTRFIEARRREILNINARIPEYENLLRKRLPHLREMVRTANSIIDSLSPG